MRLVLFVIIVSALLPSYGALAKASHQARHPDPIPTQWRLSNYIRAGWRITAVTPNQGDLANLNQMVTLEKKSGVILCLLSPKIEGDNIERFETTWCRWVR